MLEARGRVVAVDNEFIQIAIQPMSRCCSREGNTPCDSICLSRTLFQMFAPHHTPLSLKNKGTFECGDLVRIALPETVLLYSAFRLYLLPVIGLLLSTLSVALLMWADLIPHNESLLILFGFAGLAVGFWLGGQHTGSLLADKRLLLLKEHENFTQQPDSTAPQARMRLHK